MRLFLALSLALVLAAPAEAVTLERADGRPLPTWQARLDRAPVPMRDGTVRVVFGASATHYVAPAERGGTGTLYVERGRRMSELVLFHELGHDYERNVVTDGGFERWREAVGEPELRDEQVETPFGPRWLAVEHFADWYAGCASRGRLFRRVGGTVYGAGYGGAMPWAVARSSCARIYRLGLSR